MRDLKTRAIAELNAIIKHNADDIELAHIAADEVLCEVLIELGLEEVADKFREMDKYYA